MFSYIINAISKGLAFSKKEARGTFILAILILIVIGSSNFAVHLIKDRQTLPYDTLELSTWVAQVEASYSKKKEKAKPVYIESTTFIKPSFVKKSASDKEEKKIEKPILDINAASAEQLQQVKGIGGVYSKRIIKYRDLLGGFSDMNQLKEVYGLSDELVQKIETEFVLQSGIRLIRINTDSAKVLAAHPYISYDLAWIIINYRKQHGDIEGFKDLQNIKALDDSLLVKLRPYID